MRAFFVCSVLFGITFLTRYLFREQYPHYFDSILWYFGLSFNITTIEPTTPNYTIHFLYLLFGRTFDILLHDPSQTLLYLSILANSLTAPLVFLIAKKLFSFAAGIIAALLFVTGGTFWFSGMIALPHGVALFFHALVIYSIMRTITGARFGHILVAGSTSILLGLRLHESIHIFFPIMYHLVFLKRRQVTQEVLIFALVSLLWIAAAVSEVGTITRYINLLQTALSRVSSPSLAHSAFYAITIGVSVITSYTFAILAFTYPLFDLCVRGFRRGHSTIFLHGKLRPLLLIWFLPIIFFYLIIRADHAVHTLAVLLPATIILSQLIVFSAEDCLHMVRRYASLRYSRFSSSLILATFVLVVTLGNILMFFRDYGSSTPPYLTASTIYANDREFREKISFISSHYNPSKTIIFASKRYWWIVGYFLRNYSVIEITDATESNSEYIRGMKMMKKHVITKWKRSDDTLEIQSGINALIFIDDRYAEWIAVTKLKKIVPLDQCCLLTIIEPVNSGKLDIMYHNIRYSEIP